MGHFSTVLRGNILLQTEGQIPLEDAIHNVAPLSRAVEAVDYQFLAHPHKNSIYAGEKVSVKAPDIQLPLTLHPSDCTKLMRLLLAASEGHELTPVVLEGRLQAIDGSSWISCSFVAQSLPHSYRDLLGWQVVARKQHALKSPTAAASDLLLQDVKYSPECCGRWHYYPNEESVILDDALINILQLTEHKHKIQQLLHLIHPDDTKQLFKQVFRLQRKTGALQASIRIRRSPTQTYQAYEVKGESFVDENGHLYLSGQCLFLAEEAAATEGDAVAYSQLEDLLQLGNVAFCSYNLSTRQCTLSGLLRQLIGIPSKAEPCITLLKEFISPEGLTAVQLAYAKLLAGTSNTQLTLRVTTGTGRKKTLCLRAKGYYQQGQLTSIVAAVQDVSEGTDKQGQIQSKDRLIGGFLKNLPVSIVAINKQFKIVSVVGAGLREAGLVQKKLLGMPLQEVLADFVPAIHKVFQEGPQSFVSEHTVQQRPLSLFNHYYYDKKRNLAIGFSLDITRQQQAEQALKQLDQLEHRFQLMDTFVHAVAHDLRSPVVNLDMLISFLKAEKLLPEQEKYVTAMSTGTQHLRRTLDALIEILRIEKDSAVPAEEIHFQELLHELEQEYGEKLAEAKGSLNTYLQCDKICYNRAYLSSILRNLISNAIKYAYPDRAPVITICTEKRGNVVLLLVQDNGMGMDLKKWGHLLFKPFKRLNNHKKGTGIGLHLIQQMVEKNGGRIKVKSLPGQGSSFFCFLRPYQ